MKAFWKIPKEWVHEWGLSGNEALLLADIIDWPNCTSEERARRIGVSKRGVLKMMERLKNGEQSAPLLGEQSAPSLVNKVHRKKCSHGEQSSPKTVNKVHQNGEQSALPPYNPLYIEEQEEQEKNITLDKSNVPNADASAGKKTSQKKEKKEEPKVYTIQHRCRTFFENIYEQKKGDKYYYAAKDAAALKQLLNKIKFLMPEEQKTDEAKLEENYQIFINTIFHSKILGAWITDNLSLPIINDKFNEIYSQLKNGKSSSNAADNFHVFGSRNITPDILAEFA